MGFRMKQGMDRPNKRNRLQVLLCQTLAINWCQQAHLYIFMVNAKEGSMPSSIVKTANKLQSCFSFYMKQFEFNTLQMARETARRQ